jgi:hypothetical protein
MYIFLFFISVSIFADILPTPFNLEPCIFSLTPSKNLVKYQIDKTKAQHYQYAYKDIDNKYEIRIVTFSIQDELSGNVRAEAFFIFTQASRIVIFFMDINTH